MILKELIKNIRPTEIVGSTDVEITGEREDGEK